MREIKFRGKRKDTGEWVYGCFYGYFLEDNYFSWIVQRSEIILGNLKWHRVIPETVGQYTGLKDKNEKKIFEGDIIRFVNEEGLYCEQVNSQEIVKFPFVCGNAYLGEIIGNIHDNPELIDAV